MKRTSHPFLSFSHKTQALLIRLVGNFLPAPLVWSAEGPVRLLGVNPDPNNHLKSELLDWSFDQWHIPSAKSKSQSSAPTGK